MKAGDPMARKRKPVNRSPYPDYAIEAIARCIWPDIQADYENEEIQQEFAEWLKEHEMKNEEAAYPLAA